MKELRQFGFGDYKVELLNLSSISLLWFIVAGDTLSTDSYYSFTAVYKFGEVGLHLEKL